MVTVLARRCRSTGGPSVSDSSDAPRVLSTSIPALSDREGKVFLNISRLSFSSAPDRFSVISLGAFSEGSNVAPLVKKGVPKFQRVFNERDGFVLCGLHPLSSFLKASASVRAKSLLRCFDQFNF